MIEYEDITYPRQFKMHCRIWCTVQFGESVRFIYITRQQVRSDLWYFFAGFLVSSIHLNVGYNDNTFSTKDVRSVFRRQPSYMRSPSYFAVHL